MSGRGEATRRPPRVGVIGAGYWGINLVRNCAQLGVLAGVCDASPAARARVERDHPGTPTTSDPETFFGRAGAGRSGGAVDGAALDAIVIAAPAPLHEELALRAIDAGKHVFVEKPLALTVEAGERIVRAGDAAGVQVFVGHILLYHPAVVRLRELIASGAIGAPTHLRSRRLSLGKIRRHETVWWSFAPHDVALMLAIFGDEPRSARASQHAVLQPGIADFAYADFDFPGDRTAHVEVSWLDPDKSSRLDVFGTAGVLTLEDSRAGARLRLVPCGARENPATGLLEPWSEAAREIDLPAGGEPLRRELEAFLAAVATGTPAETDGRQGVRVLRALALADAVAQRTQLQPAALA